MIIRTAKNLRWDEVEKDSIELQVLAKHFELYNRTEGKSSKTIDWYNLALKQFHCFLLESERVTQLGALGEPEIREFILYLQNRTRWHNNPNVKGRRKLASTSIQTYIRALRAFFNWLYQQGYTPENRLVNLKPPKATTKIVDILKGDEISRIFRCLDRDTAAGERNYAMLLLLLDSGLRLSEMINLKLDDVNIEGGYLKVLGKGNKERIVPFGASVQKSLMRYLLHFKPIPFNPTFQNVFLTLDGRQFSKNGVKMTFQRIAEKSGVKRLHPHLCRHTFATNYLINGGDVFSLQQILGHTSLEMVRHYVNLASSHVTVQHRKYSPMDRINVANARPLRQDKPVNKGDSVFPVQSSQRL
jgi:integrase/recombinase XerC/integrase/recombinase XerD